MGRQDGRGKTDVRGLSYAPLGKTSVIFALGGTPQKLSMIATVTNQGRHAFFFEIDWLRVK